MNLHCWSRNSIFWKYLSWRHRVRDASNLDVVKRYYHTHIFFKRGGIFFEFLQHRKHRSNNVWSWTLFFEKYLCAVSPLPIRSNKKSLHPFLHFERGTIFLEKLQPIRPGVLQGLRPLSSFYVRNTKVSFTLQSLKYRFMFFLLESFPNEINLTSCHKGSSLVREHTRICSQLYSPPLDR